MALNTVCCSEEEVFFFKTKDSYFVLGIFMWRKWFDDYSSLVFKSLYKTADLLLHIWKDVCDEEAN